jgi:hypothetical protein
MVQLFATRCIPILWVSLGTWAVITLCTASQRVFIVIVIVYCVTTQSGNFWIHRRILEFDSSASQLGICKGGGWGGSARIVPAMLSFWYIQAPGLDNRCSRVRFPAGSGNFSLHHRIQNTSGAHPASYPMGTRGSFCGSKAAGAWSWPLTSI